MTTSELLLSLCSAIGVAGLETGAVETARALLSPLGPCEITPLGSLVCRVADAPADKPHLLLTAHIDSIGMVVTFIDDKGFLRVSNCGGIDRSILLAAQVQVHTSSGVLPGVVCTIPPHLNPDDSKLPSLEEIAIDVGLSAEDAKAQIALGDRVTCLSEAHELAGGSLCAQTLDDRAGCAAVILAAQALAKAPLGCALSVVLATLEETSGRGASTAAHALSPTHAIAVDVSFGHTPDAPRAKCGLLGKGPMIGIAPILDNALFAGLKAAAQTHEIPYQVEVMGSATGTDADGVASSGAGVRTGLLSIPQRYMHTPIEVVKVSDVEATADLIAAYVTDTFGGVR